MRDTWDFARKVGNQPVQWTSYIGSMINVHRTPCSLFSRLLVVADARPLRTPCWWRLRLARMDSGSRRRSARCSVVTGWRTAPGTSVRPARDGEDRRWCVPPPALPLHAARPAIRSRPPNATRASVDPREGSSDRRASPTSCRRRSDCLPRSAVSANPHPDAAGRTTRSSPSSCGNDAGRHSAHRTAPTPNHHRRYLPAGPQTAGYAAKNPAADAAGRKLHHDGSHCWSAGLPAEAPLPVLHRDDAAEVRTR